MFSSPVHLAAGKVASNDGLARAVLLAIFDRQKEAPALARGQFSAHIFLSIDNEIPRRREHAYQLSTRGRGLKLLVERADLTL